jgi:tRNA (cmo5U34)-methyltransferase
MKEKFDFNNIKEFDNHISLSIPNYDGLFDIFQAIALEYMPEDGKCIDIGCSTGKFLNDLSLQTKGDYYGVDVVDMKSPYYENITYVNADAYDILKQFTNVDIIICMFTLQFLGKTKRKLIVNELKRLVENGSKLLIAEKVFIGDAKLSSVIYKEHINQKRKHFSDTDILDKDYALLGKMQCLSDFDINKELEHIGFHSQVWQSYNFKGWFVEH